MRVVSLIGAATFAALMGHVSLAAGKETIVISGWPLPVMEGKTPPSQIGDDPVIGRLACPPLSRLNLFSKSSEPLLIRQAVEETRTESAGSTWRLELRPGIHWWDGSQVSSADLTAFVERELARVAADKGGGLWKLPAFTVKADGPWMVSVRWQNPPGFGPYVFNGVALWRPAEKGGKVEGLGYECAGAYKPAKRAFGLSLIPTAGYGYPRPNLDFHRETKTKGVSGRWLAFRFASSFGGQPTTRLSDDQATCANRIDVPLMTLINWNTSKGPTADPRLRVLLTVLTPRGELLRAGAAYLGELVSGPIPRSHPGYNSKVFVRPFDLEAVSKGLTALGYKREKGDQPRLDKDGRPLKLRIGTAKESTGLVEKVLADAFLAVGIGVQFEPLKGGAEEPAQEIHGVLTGVELNWPEVDFLTSFHSARKTSYPPWILTDTELDRQLEAYAVSLTTEKPDFTALEKVHQRLFELEPVTVLMQHKACVDFGGGLRPPSRTVATADPDWFRKLIF